MIVYWIMFLVPAFAALSPLRASSDLKRIIWVLLGIAFILLIGFRYEVGGDWIPYLRTYERTGGVPISRSLSFTDPAYSFLNWASNKVGGGIYLVDLVCGTIVIVGLLRFVTRQPAPWLGLVAAIPYMVIVVAMGYTRQSAAMGFELLALVALQDKKHTLFLIYIFLGVLFHKTAVLLLIFGFLTNREELFKNVILASAAVAIAVVVVSIRAIEFLWSVYIDAEISSSGGLVRVAMNAVPAVLMIFYRRRISPEENECRLWLWYAALSLLCLPLVLIESTIVDRVALYFMPIQLYVFSRLPSLFRDRLIRTMVAVAIVAYYASAQFVWLNFATYAPYHVPYKFYFLRAL